MKFKKLLSVCLAAALFLSMGSSAFAAGVSGSDLPSESTSAQIESVEAPAQQEEVSSIQQEEEVSSIEQEEVSSIQQEEEVSSVQQEEESPAQQQEEEVSSQQQEEEVSSRQEEVVLPQVDEEPTKSSSFTVEDGVLKKYTGDDATVSIPSTVKEIADGAFSNSHSMTEIAFPSTVTKVGTSAFDPCDKLTKFTVDPANTAFTTTEGGVLVDKSVTKIVRYPRGRTSTSFTVPTGIKTIGNSAFYKCTNLTKVILQEGLTTIQDYGLSNMTKLTTVTIPSTVTSIGKYGFSSDTALKTMSLNAKSPTIGSDAFKNVTIDDLSYYGTSSDWSSSKWSPIEAFTSSGKYFGEHVQNGEFKGVISAGTTLYIAPFVTSIPSGSLSNCTSTSFLGLPDSLSSFNSYAFDSCTSLQTLSISDSNANYKTVDGVLYNKAGTTIFRYPIAKSGTSYSVANGVKHIANSAFYKCANLTSVTLPSTVTNIYNYAFASAEKITSVNIPSGVTSIGQNAFSSTKLTSVTIPSSVTSVGNYAFSGNKNTNGRITTLTIKAKNPSTMGTGVFNDTTVGTLNYGGSSSEWDSSSWKSVLSGKWSTINYRYVISGTTLQNCVDETVTSVTIPKAVTAISSSAFDNCPKLTSFSVESGNTTFTATNGVLYTDSGKTLFRFPLAKSTSNFAVPSAVTKIANSAFYKCTGITGITMPSGLTTIDSYAFGLASNIPIITIPSSVTSIGYFAFGSMSGLKYLCINAKAPATLDDGAFKNTTGITAMAYAGTLSEWGSSKWSSQTNVKDKTKYCDTTMSNYELQKYAGTYTEVNLCSFAKKIINGALPSQLTNVTLPDALESFESAALDGSKITKFSISTSNTTFKTDSDILYSKDGKTLYRYPRAKTGNSFTVPSAVTTLGNSAFYGCSNLKTITLPTALVTIDEYALNSTGAELLTIPANVKTVNKYALNSSTLKYLVIRSKTPTTVDENAFNPSTSNLKELVFIGTSSEWTSSKWNSVTKLNASTVTKYYDADVTDKYYAKYTGSATTVTIPSFINDIYKYAFDDAASLTAINVNGNNTTYQSIDGVLYNKSGDKLIRFPNSKAATYTISDTVKTVGNSSFYNSTKIKTLTIPASVTTVEGYAFSKTALTTLTIKAKNPTIESYVFSDTTVTTVNFYGTEAEWNSSSWKSALSGKYTNLNYFSFKASLASPQAVNSTIKLTATGGAKYKFYYEKGGNWTRLQDTSTTSSYSWKPTAAGTYNLYVDIFDASGATISTQKMSYTINAVSNELTATMKAQYNSPQEAGTTIKLNVTASGGTAPYKYKFYSECKGVWTKLWDYDDRDWYNWHATTVGTHTVYCDVMDATGKVVCSLFTYQIVEGSSFVADLNANRISGQYVGTEIRLLADSSHGSGTVQYKFYMELDGNWSVLQAYSTKDYFLWTPTKAGYYNLYLDAKDSTGTVASKRLVITIEEGQTLKIKSLTANPTAPSANTNVTLKVTSTGGLAPVTYKFYYEKGGSWGKIQDFSTSSTCTWKPTSGGTYHVYVDAFDGKKNTQCLMITVNVAG